MPPTSLIQILSIEHENICAALMMLRDHDIRKSDPKWWDTFKKLEIMLFTHISKEEELYDALEKQGEDPDPILRNKITTRHAKEFFDWWPTHDSVLIEEFNQAFRVFCGEVASRAKYEERIVFPKYMSKGVTTAVLVQPANPFNSKIDRN